MGAYTNHHDLSDAQLRRMAQDDPYVMYLVLRQPAGLTAAQAMVEAARATVACVNTFSDDPAWQEPFAAWFDRGFRKVTLRAKNGPWERVKAELDCAVMNTDEYGDTVMALPPRRKSDQEPILRKLQAYSPALELDAAAAAPSDAQRMLYVLPAELEMSTGKAMAQVAHAVLICLQAYGDQPDWQALHMPGEVRVADAAVWERLKTDTDCVVVRDAGLTEVLSGSETVICLPPAPRPDWVAALPALT